MISVPVAFVAGIAAFFSPCILPLLPMWLAFMGANQEGAKSRLLVNLLFFIAGFASIFTGLGAGATMLGRLLLSYQLVLARIGGVVLILLGLQMMGFFHLPFLERTVRLSYSPKRNRLGYFLFGVILALGWTPCAGLTLAPILMMAGNMETVSQGMLLLAIYSLGFGLPFLAVGMLIGSAPLGKLSRRAARYLHFGGGLVMAVMGILLILNRWTWLQSLFL